MDRATIELHGGRWEILTSSCGPIEFSTPAVLTLIGDTWQIIEPGGLLEVEVDVVEGLRRIED